MRNSVIFPKTETRSAMMALKMAGKTVLPEAMAETLNITADAVTRRQIQNVKRRLRVRTKYTLNSMKSGRAKPFQALNKARGHDISRMFSRAGTYSNYLWLQENNQTVKALNGHSVPIPTIKARSSNDIMKSIANIYRLQQGDQLDDGPYVFTNTKTKKSKEGFVGVPKNSNRPRGLYVRTVGKHKGLIMLRNLEHEQVKIKGTHFHGDAVDRYGTPQYIKAKFNRVAVRMLRRRGLSA